MRATLLGLLIGAGLMGAVSWTASPSSVAHAQRVNELGRTAGPGQELIAVEGAVVEGRQIILLIDAQQRTLGSYLVDCRTGQITLSSVRNFRWDLQLDAYNGTEPSPEKIQALLRPR